MTPPNLMRYPFTLLIVLCSFCLHAQDEEAEYSTEKPDTAWFEMTTTLGKVPHSLYRSIGFSDQRPEQMSLGLFSTNTRYDIPVMALHPLGLQLDSLMAHLTDASAAQGALCLQLQCFTIFDVNTDFTHKIATSLRAFLYVQSEYSYRKLAVLDTTVEVSSKIYSRKKARKQLLTVTSAVLERFIADALLRTPADNSPSYNWLQVIAIDDQEKQRLPLYTAASLTDGVYLSATSFLQQRPDYTRFLPVDAAGEIIDLQVATDSSHAVLHPKDVFGYVKGGNAYIFTGDGCKPLTKRDNDFYYTGKIEKVSTDRLIIANLASLVVSYIALRSGMIFYSYWSQAARKPFLLKLDYMTGQFMPVKALDQK